MAIKKKFIDIQTPILGSAFPVLGNPESLSGKTIKLDLTRKLKGKSLEIVFNIVSKDKELIGIPKKMNLMGFFIRRMIRNNSSYVEDSFKVETKDNIQVIIKPFLITRKKVSRAIRNNLRKTTKEFLIGYIKEREYLEICENILTNDLQRALQPKLKKIYPLSFCEIRDFGTKEMNKINLNSKYLEIVKEKKLDKIIEDEDENLQEEIVEEKEEVKEQEESVEEESVEEKKETPAKKTKKSKEVKEEAEEAK
ncbi:MAG: hypothetical protein Q7S33_03300 [Nanoarchaeota archaeon]|nr:hypothetical protein [Nanoarchaeota archaeon]